MCSIPFSDWLQTKVPLRFNKDGKYRILCVSDIHGGIGYDEAYTVGALQTLVDDTHPDLVLILGDIAGPGMIHIATTEQLHTMLTGLTAPMEKAGIPWAHVYGNHDDNFGVDNRDAEAVYESFPHCVSKFGPRELKGAGNYVLPIYDTDGKNVLYNVFGMDSHRGIDGFYRDFNLPADTNPVLPEAIGMPMIERHVDFEQTMWYYNTSAEFEKYCGHKVPAMFVSHIPLRELMIPAMLYSYDTDVQDQIKAMTEKNNGVFPGIGTTSEFPSGLFRAFLERGDVKTFCCGHEHEIIHSLTHMGIFIAFDGYLSRHACHLMETFGGRVFDLTAAADNKVNVESKMVLLKDIPAYVPVQS